MLSVGNFDGQMSDRLGAPTAVSIGPGTKLMRYPELGHDYLLEQFSIRAVRVYPEKRDRLVKFYRLIRYAIP